MMWLWIVLILIFAWAIYQFLPDEWSDFYDIPRSGRAP